MRPTATLIAMLLLAALAVGCDRDAEPATPGRVRPEAVVEAPPEIPTTQLLARHIDSLAHAGGHRTRVAHTEGNRWAQGYIRRALSEAGVESRLEPIGVAELANVVATIRGASDTLLVVGAHFDASASRDAAWRGRWRTMPAPGAVDNASGVAALIEIARAIGGAVRPRYSIEIVAFDAEEYSRAHRGHHLGSRAYARTLRARGVPVAGAIILDMVASKGSMGRVVLFSTRRSRALAAGLDAEQRRRGRIDLALSSTPCSRSDNEAFDALGLPAVLLMESCAPWRSGPGERRRFKAYHTGEDRPQEVDVDLLAEVVAIVASFIDGTGAVPPVALSGPRAR